MATFTIPTIYTAVDKFSGPVKAMERANASFGSRLESTTAKSERLFRKLTPGLSDATKQMLSFASSAAIVSGAIATVGFSTKAIMEYETSIQSLSAITGTSGKELDVFKDKITSVSLATKESSINVAKAFTQIGNNSPELLKDASALAEVTKQSIILAQASKMELGPSADALTTIMNQFSKPAKEAKSVIDLLAGGMVIGSTDIDKVADAMTRFGGVASQVAGVSLEESVTAIEAISDKMKDAEKIGSQFKNIFLKMSSLSVQDPKAIKDLNKVGVNIKLVESKTEPLINKLKELKKLLNVKGGLEHVFGTENLQSLIPLLNSTEKYEGMIKKLTQSEEAQNAAQKMADKNNDTLSKRLDQLKDKWITVMTTSKGAKRGLELFSKAVIFLTDNLDTIVTVGVSVIGFFTAWKAINLLLQASIIATNLVAKAFYLVDMVKMVMAVDGVTFATGAWTVAQNYLNAAMAANPIGLIILAVAGLTYAFYNLYKNWDTVSTLFSTGLSGIKRDFLGTWLIIEDSFMSMIENITLGWKTMQFSLGITSQKELTQATTSTMAAQQGRTKQIVSNAAASKAIGANEGRQIIDAFIRDAKKNDSGFSTSKMAIIDKVINEPTKELINPKQAQAEATANQMKEQKGEVKVTFENAPSGLKTESTSNGAMNIKVAVGSTMSAAR